MLCPSISVNLFEHDASGGQCPCKKENCKCLLNSVKPKASLKPVTEIVPLNPKYDPLRRAKNKYNPPNVCITLNPTVTDRSLARLFANGVRLVHIQLAFGTRAQVDRLILKVCTAIAAHYIKHPTAILIALALEIGGRVLRTGRLRNDEPVELVKGNRVFLTSIPEYRYCSTKDLIFVSNLEKYFARLQVGEFIFINKSAIQLVIVKVVEEQNMLSCCVLRGNQLDSNQEVILPYLLDQDANLTPEELSDCEFAVRNQADFIVVPIVSNAEYLDAIRELCQGELKARVCLLSEVEPTCFLDDRSNVFGIIEASDGLWWRQNRAKMTEFESRSVCRAKQLCRPIVFAIGGKRRVSV